MPASTDGDRIAKDPGPSQLRGKREIAGILVLALLVAGFLASSWRKWSDPLTDAGQQFYGIWRLSQGAALYHDFDWLYGPISIYFNAALFRVFGPGIMVLVAANLVIYALILALAYIAFRRAWGPLAAFAALAVFISIFSFSHLCDVGNYNFATPYTHEVTHGFLLMLVTAFVAVRWCRKPSRLLALILGLCGGVAAVMKPEYMLAGGVLGIAALVLRHLQRQRVRLAEYALIVAGVLAPTLAFASWFARTESWKTSLTDACSAWWLALVVQVQSGSATLQSFSGFDHPWANGLKELDAALRVSVVIGAIWAGGWIVNRPWSKILKCAVVVGAAAVICGSRLEGGWFEVGRCFPGIIAMVFGIVLWRMCRELKEKGEASESTLMALTLVLLAAAMMARMALRSRVYHFGFFQGAFAGMIMAAAMVAEVPRWVGQGTCGRRLALLGSGLVLLAGCGSIAESSYSIRSGQTLPVGSGRDRIYAFNRDISATGTLVSWAVEQMESTPPQATLLVLPEGHMINYLTRRLNPMPVLPKGADEQVFVDQLKRTPPDYVIIISHQNNGMFGVYGSPGNPGYITIQWVNQNYAVVSQLGGNTIIPSSWSGAVVLRRVTAITNP